MANDIRILEDCIPPAWVAGLVDLCGVSPHTHGVRQPDGSWSQVDCQTPGKRPLSAGFNSTAAERWKGCSVDTLMAAAQAQLDAGGNLGLVPPPGVVVIDADTSATVDWLDEICPADTPVMRRTDSSAHYYLRFPADLALKAKRIAWQNDDVAYALDLRTPGKAQAVVPPSRHKSGVHYVWERGLPQDPADVPSMPQQLEDLLRAHVRPEAAARVNVDEIPGHDRVRFFANRMCRYLTSRAEAMERTRAFAEVVYRGRPERLADALAAGGEVERIVASGWDRFGRANPLTEDRTDQGFVDLFLMDPSRSFAFEPASKQWFRYTRGMWEHVAVDWVHQSVGQLHEVLFDDAAREVADATRRDRLMAMSRQLRMASRVKAIVARLAVEPSVLVDVSVFDSDTNLLLMGDDGANVRFVVELDSHHSRKAEPADYITRQMGSYYATPSDWLRKRWAEFLVDTFPDPEVLSFVHRAVGVSTLGVLIEHVILFLYGQGGTGKSTFLNTLLAVFGSYGAKVAFETFAGDSPASGSAATPDIARLRGVRFVVCSEIPNKARLGARMKDLTGGDRLLGRHLFGHPFEFNPQFTAWVAGNVAPEADFLDSGIERRLRVVPADHKPRTVNPALLSMFTSEAGLLVVMEWVLEGLRAFQSAGSLGSCPAVQQAAAEYWASMNPVDDWFRECARKGPGEVGSTEAYQHFIEWIHETQGLRAGNPSVPNPQKFGKALARLGVPNRKGAKGKRMLVGLVLGGVQSTSSSVGGHKLPDLKEYSED